MMNKAAEEQWGKPFEQLRGTDAGACFPPEQMAGFLAADRQVFAAGKLVVFEEQVWNGALGENRLLQVYKKPVFDEGRPLHLICLAVDITERMRAAEAMQQSFSQLRQLTEHLETIKEDERRRLALEIHDELGQNLLAVRMEIEMLHARAGRRHRLLKDRVGMVLETIDATIRSVRAIMNELHPSTLELGLPAALEWLLGQFEKRTGIRCRLSINGDLDELPERRLTEAVFRIVQEALLNILRHANASEVELILGMGPAHLAITIIDDGVGMQPGDAGKALAFGLRGMRERLEAFGGELAIDSGKGDGTTLAMLLPLRQQENA
jgi:two-component system sensor histidine kinase UhpB